MSFAIGIHTISRYHSDCEWDTPSKHSLCGEFHLGYSYDNRMNQEFFGVYRQTVSEDGTMCLEAKTAISALWEFYKVADVHAVEFANYSADSHDWPNISNLSLATNRSSDLGLCITAPCCIKPIVPVHTYFFAPFNVDSIVFYITCMSLMGLSIVVIYYFAILGNHLLLQHSKAAGHNTSSPKMKSKNTDVHLQPGRRQSSRGYHRLLILHDSVRRHESWQAQFVDNADRLCSLEFQRDTSDLPTGPYSARTATASSKSVDDPWAELNVDFVGSGAQVHCCADQD